MDSLAERIAAAMEIRDMSQADLARAAGMSRTLVSKIVNGKTPNPTFESVIKIADALDVSLDYLAGKYRRK